MKKDFGRFRLTTLTKFSLLELIFIVNLKSIPWPDNLSVRCSPLPSGDKRRMTFSANILEQPLWDPFPHSFLSEMREKLMKWKFFQKFTHQSTQSLRPHFIYCFLRPCRPRIGDGNSNGWFSSRKSPFLFDSKWFFVLLAWCAIITQNIVSLNDRLSSGGGSDVVRGRKNSVYDLNHIIRKVSLKISQDESENSFKFHSVSIASNKHEIENFYVNFKLVYSHRSDYEWDFARCQQKLRSSSPDHNNNYEL